MLIHEKCFFASSNSGYGFKSYFDAIFDSCEHLYIIKGGPGTGKSSFMKALAKAAVDKGYEVELFLCSADTDSLDAIIIQTLNIGIVDGTSPHNMDIVKPGIHDDIINLGMFWDIGKLKERESEIIAYTEEKTQKYKTVYGLLQTALTSQNASLEIIGRYFEHEKAVKYIRNQISKLKKPKTEFVKSIRLTEAISTKGIISTNGFCSENTRIIYLKDKHNISKYVFDIIEKELTDKALSFEISFNPLNPDAINAIHITDYDITITTNMYEKSLYKTVNLSRFILGSISNKDKIILKNIDFTEKSLIKNALLVFEDIGKIHSEIEGIYIGAMDFKSMEKYRRKMIKQILS